MMAFVDIDEPETAKQQTPKLSVRFSTKPHKQQPKFFLNESAYFRAVIVMMELNRLDRYELTHIQALVFYGAKCLDVAEKKITDLLFTELGIGHIESIQRKDYNQVVDFLRDFDQCDRLIKRQAG